MRAITRKLRKVLFYRETMTDIGPLFSRTETLDGVPIVRASTPRPVPIASDTIHSVAPMTFLVEDGGLKQ